MALRPLLTIQAAILLTACSDAPTQILVEVDSDLPVPEGLDEIVVAAESPADQVQMATAKLGPGQLPLPRTLAMVHEDGPLGPFRITVTGRRAESALVSRIGTLTFQPGQVLVWRVDLAQECVNVDCSPNRTCAPGGCRSLDVPTNELVVWDGTPPPSDAGTHGCQSDETCNGLDDDCDGSIDEGIDTDTDPMNCGACGVSCNPEHTVGHCEAGRCVIDACEPGFDDCDSVPANGCETDTTSSPAHCGECRNACRAFERACCAGFCARSC